MTEEHADRRRYGRVPVTLTVRVSTIDPEPDRATGKPCFRVSEERCGNLSRGGAYLTTPDPIAPGRRVLVEVNLPGGPQIQAIGRVAWSCSMLSADNDRPESGTGIEFLGTSPEQMTALEEFLARASRRPVKRRSPLPGPPLAPGGGA